MQGASRGGTPRTDARQDPADRGTRAPAPDGDGSEAASPIDEFVTKLLATRPSHDQLLHRRADGVDLENIAAAVQAHRLDADALAAALGTRSANTERCLLLLALAFARGFEPR